VFPEWAWSRSFLHCGLRKFRHTGQMKGGLHGMETLFNKFQPIIHCYKIRSSAIAEGPRDASCQLKSCQLPRSSAETPCTTSPWQIEVMKLEVFSGAMGNKRVHSTMMRSSRFRCPIGVINKRTTDELWISPVYRRLALAKFSKTTMYKLFIWPNLKNTHSSQD